MDKREARAGDGNSFTDNFRGKAGAISGGAASTWGPTVWVRFYGHPLRPKFRASFYGEGSAEADSAGWQLAEEVRPCIRMELGDRWHQRDGKRRTKNAARAPLTAVGFSCRLCRSPYKKTPSLSPEHFQLPGAPGDAQAAEKHPGRDPPSSTS